MVNVKTAFTETLAMFTKKSSDNMNSKCGVMDYLHLTKSAIEMSQFKTLPRDKQVNALSMSRKKFLNGMGEFFIDQTNVDEMAQCQANTQDQFQFEELLEALEDFTEDDEGEDKEEDPEQPEKEKKKKKAARARAGRGRNTPWNRILKKNIHRTRKRFITKMRRSAVRLAWRHRKKLRKVFRLGFRIGKFLGKRNPMFLAASLIFKIGKNAVKGEKLLRLEDVADISGVKDMKEVFHATKKLIDRRRKKNKTETLTMEEIKQVEAPLVDQVFAKKNNADAMELYVKALCRGSCHSSFAKLKKIFGEHTPDCQIGQFNPHDFFDGLDEVCKAVNNPDKVVPEIVVRDKVVPDKAIPETAPEVSESSTVQKAHGKGCGPAYLRH